MFILYYITYYITALVCHLRKSKQKIITATKIRNHGNLQKLKI